MQNTERESCSEEKDVAETDSTVYSCTPATVTNLVLSDVAAS